MGYGEGARRRPRSNDPNHLSNIEVRGPRHITSSDVDRMFEDGRTGRFLACEEKTWNEPELGGGQRRMLEAMARKPGFTVWIVVGDRTHLEVTELLLGNVIVPRGGTADDYERAVFQWFNCLQEWRPRGAGNGQMSFGAA